MNNLYDFQLDAVNRMHNGCILCGGVGSGKSRTSIAYYCKNYLYEGSFLRKLYIITTAKKRDSKEWNEELVLFDIPDTDVTVDSWNNIKKYVEVENAFFIFDEQRVGGQGSWSKNFLKITKKNHWVLLSATPGDNWMDYLPVFMANGYFRTKSDFVRRHVIYNPKVKFPKIDRYLNQGSLKKMRESLLVSMDFKRDTIPHKEIVVTEYDQQNYRKVMRERVDIQEGLPLRNAAAVCYELRKVCNSDTSRIKPFIDICKDRKRVIVFYNFNYELDILRRELTKAGIPYGELNGHRHDDIPKGYEWAYLVQYTSGAEGWNCIKTDTIIFWSMNYSYKAMVQASGRIDRANTRYKDLYYYYFKTKSPIDTAINLALKNKKIFNETGFIGSYKKY